MKRTAQLFVIALATIGALSACAERETRRDHQDDTIQHTPPIMHQDTTLRDTVGMDTSALDPRTEPRVR